MTRSISEQTVLVTGAGRGLGAALARAFAREGARVAVNYRHSEKAALLAFTRTASKDLGPLGVTVNMVSGGLLRTTDASAATPEAVFDAIAAMTPVGRVTTPDDLADAALFFAAPWSRAVTGQNLIVDGGLVCG